MIRPFMLHDRIKACTLSTGQVRAVLSTSGGIGQRSGDPMSTDQRPPDAMRRKTVSHLGTVHRFRRCVYSAAGDVNGYVYLWQVA